MGRNLNRNMREKKTRNWRQYRWHDTFCKGRTDKWSGNWWEIWSQKKGLSVTFLSFCKKIIVFYVMFITVFLRIIYPT